MKPSQRLQQTGEVTHEGGRAARLTADQQLRRSVLSCLLWEKTFYEDGESIADRIISLVPQVPADLVADLAVRARNEYKLRHVPLLLCRELARKQELSADTLSGCLQRADDLYEFLALYWEAGKCPVSHRVREGLNMALIRFGAYQLAKYDRKGPVQLRDVIRLCHPKPSDSERADLWRQVVKGELPTPDTWEVALSGGADKKTTWERLLAEGKLGGLAFLRNLRNMHQAGVSKSDVEAGMAKVDFSRVLPFRFLAAAHACPAWEDLCDQAMLSLQPTRRLGGRTVVLVDVSGSMDDALSEKSDLRRMDAACGLAILAREMSGQIAVYTFSNALVAAPPRRGMALRDAIVGSQEHGGTYLAGALDGLKKPEADCDRLIVVTDEQAHDDVGGGVGRKRYLINVASYKNGVGYGDWVRLDGFSEAVLDWIAEIEDQKKMTR